MKQHIAKWVVGLCFPVLIAATSVQADRGRPVIAKKDGLFQLQTNDGRPIRGTMFNLYNSPNNPSDLLIRPWSTYWTKWRVTSCRIWTRRKMLDGKLDVGTYGSVPEPELERRLDYIVEQCGKYNLYAIIDYHDVSGNTGNCKSPTSDAYVFWKKYAARYKDRTHVIYEIYNEPTYGYGLSETARLQISELYKFVRGIAPNTHIIAFSCGKYSYDGTIVGTVDKTPGINWTNTSVGIHTYAMMRNQASIDGMKKGSAKYAMICTEPGSAEDPMTMMFETAGLAWTGNGYFGKPGFEWYVKWDGGYGGNATPVVLSGMRDVARSASSRVTFGRPVRDFSGPAVLLNGSRSQRQTSTGAFGFHLMQPIR